MTTRHTSPEQSLGDLLPWVDAVLGMSDIADAEFDGMDSEEYKLQILQNMALDIHHRRDTRTKLGARILVARCVELAIRDSEGFPAYARGLAIHDGILGLPLGTFHSMVRVFRKVRKDTSYIDSLAD